MGIFDKIKDEASDLVHKAGDMTEKAKDGVGDLTGKVKDQAGDIADKAHDQADDLAGQAADKAGEMTDDATGGRFSDQANQGVDVAKQRLGRAAEAIRAEADQQA